MILKKSGCGLNGTYSGGLAYGNGITISYPISRRVNCLLYICHSFALSNKIMYNTKKHNVHQITQKRVYRMEFNFSIV